MIAISESVISAMLFHAFRKIDFLSPPPGGRGSRLPGAL